jgi:hypothetical protein
MMNCNVYGRKRPWSAPGTIPVVLEGLRRTTMNLKHVAWFSARELNREPFEYINPLSVKRAGYVTRINLLIVYK